ncbi:unnamed protein product [Clonostachys rosea]|uniref:Protein kinase domain-containing protein n=1 Tax=Bionectria ochroleuca TaxID=29856 RepID=A0ABY6U4B1_BIOOC|nr:unnamed protein product [Clonostachys rosea]
MRAISEARFGRAPWTAPELEPDRLWKKPEVIIYNVFTYPGVSSSALGYDAANRSWYLLNLDTVYQGEEEWLSETIIKHIVDYQSTHGTPPNFNTINTTCEGSPVTFEKSPYEEVARPIHGNFCYGSQESDTLPTTTFDQIKEKMFLTGSIDRCVWNGTDCIFKRIEFHEDLLPVELRTYGGGHGTAVSIWRPNPGGTCWGVAYAMGYKGDETDEEDEVEVQPGRLKEKDPPVLSAETPTSNDFPLLPVTETHLQSLVEAVEELSRAGVLHGDVADRNTLLTPDNRLLLIDMGEVAPDYKGDAHALGKMMDWVCERVDWDTEALSRVKATAARLQSIIDPSAVASSYKLRGH